MNAKIWGRWLARLFKNGPKRLARRTRPRNLLNCETLEDRLVPATYTWTGLGGSADWSVGKNWMGGVAPSTAAGAINDLVFGPLTQTASLPTTNNISGLVVNSINFSGDTPKGTGYNLGGDAITLVGLINVGAGLGTETISLNMTLTPSTPTLQQTFTVNSASTLDISGALTGSEPASGSTSAATETASETLNKSGSGILQLDGNNSNYTGAILVNTGILAITNSSALGTGNTVVGASTSGTTTVATGAQLQVNGGTAALKVPEKLILNGSGIINDGALLNTAGSNSWTGTITMESNSTIGANPNTTLSIAGLITDTGSGFSLSKAGAGTVVLSRVGGNTYRGQTIINNGILAIQDPLSLGAGAISSSSQSGTPQAETIVNYNSTTGVAGTLELDFSGTLGANDPNGVLQNPALPYNNTPKSSTYNPYVGFQVFNDILNLNGPGFSGLGAFYNLAGNNSWDGSVELGSPNNVPNTGNVSIGVSSTSTTNPNTTLTISGVVSSVTPLQSPVANLLKIGGGNLVLNDANTFTGNTFIENGAIDAGDSLALGSPTTNSVYVGFYPNKVATGLPASLQMQVDSGLDGTSAGGLPEMTHYRNLGYDSVTGSGPAQEIDVTGTTGTFTLGITLYSATGLASHYSTGTININDASFASDLAYDVAEMLEFAGYSAFDYSNNMVKNNVSVTEDLAGSGSGNLYRISFSGELATQDIPLMTATITSPPPAPPVAAPTVMVNPVYGLTMTNPLTLVGQGLGTGAGTGALESISGQNIYSGPIALDGGVGIGVDADTRTGHNLADSNYLTNDYSLTIQGNGTSSGIISGGGINKVGMGDLILPTANSFTGANDIEAGWVTVENNQSLGVQQNLTQTLQSYTTVAAGAAVMLDDANASSGQFLTLANNFLLSGNGLIPGTLNKVTTPNVFGLIDQDGAVENINGNNLLTGIIQLNGNAGIGVEQVFPSGTNAPTSQLTISGPIWNDGGTAGGITKLGSRRLIIAGPGTYTGNVNIDQGVLLLQSSTGLGEGNTASPPTVTVASGAALEMANTLSDLEVSNSLGQNTYTSSVTGGIQEGLEVQGINLVLNGTGDPTFGDTPLTVLSNNDTTTGPNVQTIAVSPSGSFTLSYGGQTTGTFTIGSTTGSTASTAAAIQSALDALTSISNFAGASATVVQNGNVYLITIVNPLAVGLGYTVTATPVVPTGTGNTADFYTNTTQQESGTEMLAPVNDPLVSTDNLWNGPVGLDNTVTITVPTNSRLILGGTVSNGSNATSSGYGGSGLTFVGGGELDLDGNNTYSGTTNIQQGVVTAGSDTAFGATGVADIQTIKLSNTTPNTPVPIGTKYVLTYTSISNVVNPVTITYTGNVATDEAAITSALDALPSIGGSDVGGSVSVTEIISNTGVTITITFGGTLTGFQQNQLGVSILSGSNVNIAVSRSAATEGAGGTIVSAGASLQLAGSITIAGEPLIVQGDGSTNATQILTVLASSSDYNFTYTGADGNGNIVTDPSPIQLTPSSDQTDIKTAIQQIPNFQDEGGTVTVTADAVQTITIPSGTTGTFTLSLTGADSTGTTVTETTVPLSVTSLTLTNDIQTALDALSNIGGVGGSVTVTETSTGVYLVAFGGSLSGKTPQLLAVNNTGVTGGTVTAATDSADKVYSIVFSGTLAGKDIPTLGFQSTPTGVSVVTTQIGSSAVENLPSQWFQVGPSPVTGGQTEGNQNVAGTVTAIAVDPSDPNTIYIATAGGGVWKTQNGGQNWYSIFDSIPEIQTVTVPTAAGNFTLSFTSAGGVTDTTTTLSSSDPNLALDMQNALDNLGDIGGAGSLVTVFQSSASATSSTYEISFGGEFAGYKEQPLTPSLTTIKVNELEVGADSQFALYVGSIAIDPNRPNVIYVGTGVANNSSDSYYGTGVYESQNAGVTWTLLLNNTTTNNTVVANPFYGRVISSMQVDPVTGDLLVADGDATTGQDTVETLTMIGDPSPFTVSLTAADATGLSVTDTTPNPIPLGPVTFTDPITGITYFGYAATADELQYELNQFSNIGGVGGSVVVPLTPVNGDFGSYTITFEGTLSNFTEPAFVTDYPLPGINNPPWIGVQVSAVAGPSTDINGTTGQNGSAPGIWEFTSSNGGSAAPAGTWQDLTSVVSLTRSAVVSGNTADPIYGPGGTLAGETPDTPGPDDDYQVYFPQANATWTDLQIVRSSVNEYILFAALGTSSIGTNNTINAQGIITGTPADGVFWSNDFRSAGGSQGVSGITWYQGNPFVGTVDAGDAVLTPDNEASDMFPSPYYVGQDSGVAPENGNIKISAVTGGTYSDEPFNQGFVTIYASVSTAGGGLEGIYVSTDGGVDWAAVASLPNPTYLSGEGQYDNAIYAVNQTTVYVGGQVASGDVAGQTGQIYETTDGGATWSDVSVINNTGPHDSQHAIVGDDGNGVLFGNDGGIFELNTTNAEVTPTSWSDLNGDLSTSQITSIATDPASIAGLPSNPVSVNTVAGVAYNGTAGFSSGQTWAELDDSAGGEMGTSQIYIDPINPNIIYEEQTQLGSGNGPLIRVSTNDGQTWTTIFSNPAAITPATPNEILSAVVPFQMDQINPQRLLVGGGLDGGLYEALNGSSGSPNWINVGATLPIDANVIGLASYQGAYVFDSDFPGVTDQGANTYVPGTFYVSDGTSVYVTKNDGQTWINADPTLAATPLGNIVQLVVDPRDSNTVYAVVNGFNQGGVWVSHDAGAQWTQVGTNNGLPNIPVEQLVVDPRNNNLYVGTDNGVFTLVDGASYNGSTPSGSWVQFGIGMPNVQVDALVLNETTNTLLAGTYGRGVFELMLDNAETAPAPVSTSAVTGLSGPTFWTGPVILSGNTTVGADGVQNLPNGIAAGTISFVGQISDMVSGDSASFDPTITKVGGSNVIFGGANVYGGLTVVEQGNLIVDNEQALGAGETTQGVNDTADGTFVDQGAALELESNLGSETVTLNGDGSLFDGHNTGSLRNISGDNTFTGNVILGTNDPNSTITIDADSGSILTLTSGIVSDTNSGQSNLSLIKEGTGTIAMADANTYTGSTYVYQGALEAENNTALGTATGANSVTVLDGAQLQLSSGVTVSGLPLNLSGTGIFGTGALLNVSGVNTWLGNVIFSLLPGFSQFTLPLSDIAIGVSTGSTLTLEGNVSELQQSGQVANPNNPAGTGYAIVGQESGLNKVGGGTLVLQNPYSTTSQTFSANTFSGGITVTSGVVVAGDAGALGSHPTVDPTLGTVQQVVVVGEDLSAAPGTFQLSFDNATTTLAGTTSAIALETKINGANGLFAKAGFMNVNAIVVETPIETTSSTTPTNNQADGNLYTITFGGPLVDTNIPLTASGSNGIQAAASFVTTGGDDVLVDTGAELDLNTTLANTLASATTQIDVTGHTLTLNGSGLSGNGAFQNAAGDNTWSGPVVIQTGPAGSGTTSANPTLNASIAAASGTSLTISDPIAITVPAGSLFTPTLTFGGAGTGGAGTIIIPSGTTQPTADNGTSLLDATTVITGGDVQVDGSLGNVELAGSLATGTTGVVDAGGALSGLGTVGTVTDAGPTSGGIVNPGDNGDSTLLNSSNPYPLESTNGNTVGTLTVSSVSFSNNASGSPDTFDVYVGDPATPNSSTLLNVTGSINLNNAILAGYVNPDVILTVGSPPPPPVTIITTGTNGVIGTFFGPSTTPSLTGAVSATIAYIDNEKFEVDYFSNKVEITRVAETVTLGNITISVPPAAPLPPQPPSSVSPPTASIYYGEDVSASVTVKPESSQVLLNGTVVEFQIIDPFGDVLQVSAPVTLTSGDTYTATIDLPYNILAPLATGSSPGYQISAYYEGYNPTTGAVLFSPASDGTVQGYSSTQTGPEEVVTVAPTPTTTTVAASQSGSAYTYGTSLTFTATVSGNLPTADLAKLGTNSLPIQSPAITVEFFDTTNGNTVALGTGTLMSTGATTATATFTTSSLTQGAHSISAVYLADGVPDNYSGSASSKSVNLSVTAATDTMSLSVSPTTINYGGNNSQATLVATVTPPAGNSGQPTGLVTFKDGATTLGTASLSTVGNVTTATLVTGSFQIPANFGATQTITASYAGDGNYQPNLASASLTVDQLSTTTALSGGPSSAPAGTNESYTATITPSAVGGAYPTGTVTFVITNTQTNATYTSTQTVSTSFGLTTATYSTSTLPAGSYSVVASYGGDSNYLTSVSSPSSLTVTPASTTITLSAPGSATQTQAVPLTATVDTTNGGVATTGTVIFTDTTTNKTLGSATVVNGQASILSVLGGPLGNHAITASFTDSTGTFGPSSTTSPTLVDIVANGTRVSTVKVASSLNPSTLGQSVTLTATVKDAGTGAAQTPSGSVEFEDKTTGANLGYAVLSNVGGVMTASITTADFQKGNNSIVAVYSGSSIFATATSAALVQVVNGTLGSTVSLTSSSANNTSYYGLPVTFTATVAATVTGSPTPTGTVTFTITNSTTNAVVGTGTGTLSTTNGKTTATFSTTTIKTPLAPGSYTVTATYNGDGNYLPGSTRTITQTVDQDLSTTTLTGKTSSVYGQSITYKATVVNNSDSVLTPTGTVTFGYMVNGSLVPLGTVKLATIVGTHTASALFTIKSLAPNSYSIVAVYNGNSDIQTSQSGVLFLNVNMDNSVVGLAASTNTQNTPVTFTATVAAASPGSGIPSGTVSFYINGAFEGTFAVSSSGKASFSLPNGLPAGSYNVQAVYSGDDDFNGSSASKTFTFTIGRGT